MLGCTRPYPGPATGLEKAPGDRDRDINDLLDRETYKSEAKSWSNAPPCTADRQISGWLAARTFQAAKMAATEKAEVPIYRGN